VWCCWHSCTVALFFCTPNYNVTAARSICSQREYDDYGELINYEDYIIQNVAPAQSLDMAAEMDARLAMVRREMEKARSVMALSSQS
jgi:hypothetical protein